MIATAHIVHFVVPDGPEGVHGHCRPAIIVADRSAEQPGLMNLIVFRDGFNDRRLLAGPTDQHPAQYDMSVVEWREGIRYAHPKEFGTWHYPTSCREGS